MSTEYYPKYGNIHIEDLLTACPEIEVESHDGDEVIKLGRSYIHFSMDDDLTIGWFKRYGGNYFGEFANLVNERLGVEFISEYEEREEMYQQYEADEKEAMEKAYPEMDKESKLFEITETKRHLEEDYKKSHKKRMEKIEKDCKIDPTSTIGLKDIVNEILEKNRNVNVEKLEPKRFYKGVFRLFSQLPLENFIDADDDSFDNAIVLYKEFLQSEFNGVWGFVTFDDEVLAMNKWLEHTYTWTSKRISSNNAPF